MIHRIARLTLIALLVLSAGCSTTNFLYNRLHLIIPWYLDDYVDLDGAQRDQLDALLKPFWPGIARRNCRVISRCSMA